MHQFNAYFLNNFEVDCSTLFSEPNSESLSFEIENAESTISTWISVDSSTGTLSGTVPNTAGTYTQSLEIHAYDPKRFKAVIKIEITVLPNTPPIFQGVPFTSLDFYEGILYDIDFGQYVVDDANDTISFNDTYSDPPIPGMSIDATTGVFSLTPDFANTPNTYTLHVVARDNHTAAADGNATYDVTINFLFNREPVRNKDVVDFSTFEGGDVNITLDDDTYSDPEGEDITYSYTSNDTSIYSWLTLDNATRDFSGTSPSLGINVTYLITLNANDHNPNSAEVGQTFLISIMSNKIPELDQGLPTPENPSVYHPFNYQVPSDAFKDSDGDSFTIRIELLPNEFPVSYDSGSGNINGILNDNTKHGDYKIRFYVEDTYNFSSFIHDMPFTYLENFPPQIITPAVNPPWVNAYDPFEYRIAKTNYKELENETITYSFSFVDPAYDGWLSLSETIDELVFSGTPDNSVFGNPEISIILDDTQSDTNSTEEIVELWINENFPPSLTGTANNLRSVKVGSFWDYTFDLSWITEPESEPMTYEWRINPALSWVSCTINSTHVYYEGTPDYNDQARLYQIVLVASDPHSEVANYTWARKFRVFPNIPPVIAEVDNQTLKTPDGLSWSYGSDIASDADTIFAKSIRIDGSTSIPTWLEYNLSDYSFNIANSSNSILGNYTISLGVSDGYSDEVFSNFSLTIQGNLPPVRQMAIDNMVVINYKRLEYTFEDLYTLFKDPDERDMTREVRLAGGSGLPLFLTFDETNDTIYGTPSLAHVGTWNIEYAAIDDHDLESIISFKIVVKRKSKLLIYL